MENTKTDKKTEFDSPKEIGRVYISENYVDECPNCGLKQAKEFFTSNKEGSNIIRIHERFISFCKCGNVFITKDLMDPQAEFPNRAS